MAKSIMVACALLAGACHGDKAASTPAPIAVAAQAPARLDPRLPLRVESLGVPVRSARAWTTALVPNARGGWNFITQIWELREPSAPEWVVVDLDKGTFTVTDAQQQAFAISKYQVRNQLRAANGRVFFPLSGTALAYYDPADETVKELPPILPPTGPDREIYSATFGPDGMLYGGTESNALPTIVQIDPDTLKSRVLGHVGRDRETYSYAYQIAVDPPWVYATVGELPWELAALNMKTGASKVLATRADRGWMNLDTGYGAVRAQLVTGVHTPQVVSEYVWCHRGNATPVVASAKLPFAARKVEAPIHASSNMPELDLSQLAPDSHGVGRIRWRSAGSTAWRVTEFRVKHTLPIAIESLAALADGTILGGTKQYHGFFELRGGSTTFLGGPSPSRTRFAVLDGFVYMTGYPNGVLYAYDPERPWTRTTPEKAVAPDSNPRVLGSFTQSGAKYASFMVPSRDRLYFAGRRERDGKGAGVGYYEPATKRFAGHHDHLLDVEPAGLAVLPALRRVVLSTHVRRGATVPQAELVVYDENLSENERLVVKPGLASTGLIFPTSIEGVIVGVLRDAVYRYDVRGKKLLGWRPLSAECDAIARRPADGTIWVVLGTSLVRIDPVTLDMVQFGSPDAMPAHVDELVWQGDDLYASVGADLYRIARVGRP